MKHAPDHILTLRYIYLFTVGERVAAAAMFRNIHIKVVVIWILSASHKNHYKTHNNSHAQQC